MKTIDIDFKISGTRLSIPFRAVCSVIKKEFLGNVIIEYQPSGKVLEYVETEKSIKQITEDEATAEELASRVFKEVKESISPHYLKVSIDVKDSRFHKPTLVWLEESF